MRSDTRQLRAPARPRPSATALVAALAAAVLLLGLTSGVAAGATTVTPRCDNVNVRSGPGTTYARKATLRLGAQVTVVATVTGGSYGSTCGGWVSGHSWYRISAVNGKSAKSLYGVSYVYGASRLFKTVTVAPPSPTPTATSSPTATPALSTTTVATATLTPRCDYVNVRSGPSTTYTKKATLRLGAQVTVVATVTGGSYGSTCGGWVSGHSWYRISAVNGKSAKSLYGVPYVYGATKLFKAVAAIAPSASPSPPPSPTPSADPSSDPSADPSADASPGTLPDGVTPLGDAVQFFGRGYGHGVGLSQYGARGRAAAGQGAKTILAHYYPGTSLGTTANATIRVLVLSGFSASATNPLRIYGRNGGWTIDDVSGTFPADAQLQVVPDSTTATRWRITVSAADGSPLLSRAAPSMPFIVRPATSTTVLQLYSKPSSYDRYRGLLRVIATSSSALRVVNALPLESYLRGAVPAEMPASWPTEALKSQAIAARSYAAYRLHPGTGSFDVYDDTRSQVYRGQLAEKSSTDAAVSGTAGKVVVTGGGAIANTLYHSADGGATENNENVFVSSTGAIVAGKVGYLRGSSDRAADGTSYDRASPYATWKTTTYSLAAMQADFAADSRTDVGELVGLDLRNRGVSGRLISVTLYGADGTTRTVSGAVFISVFNAQTPTTDPAMRNTLFDLAPIP